MAENKSEDMVSLPKSDIQELLESNRAQSRQIAELTKRLNDMAEDGSREAPKTLKKVTHRSVSVSFLDGKPVLGFKNRLESSTRRLEVYEAPDPDNPKGENTLFVDVILKGVAQPVTLKYANFREEAEGIECKIVSTREAPWEVEHGAVRKREVDGYSMVELDEIVPLQVEGVDRFFTVELPDGEQVEIPARFCNMTRAPVQ